MLIIIDTKRTENGEKDNYQLADTMAEAQSIIAKLAENPTVQSWVIADVIEASEPSWAEKREIWGTTE